MSKVKFLIIDYNKEEKTIFDRVVEVEKKSSYLEDFYEAIECDLIDIVRFNEQLSIVVDDEGLLKTGNLVFKVTDQVENLSCKLAGKLVFVKNKNMDDITGFTSGEVFELLLKLHSGYLKIEPIGITV